jgi:hypothetical protein
MLKPSLGRVDVAGDEDVGDVLTFSIEAFGIIARRGLEIKSGPNT